MNYNPNMSNKDVANLIFIDFKTKKPVLNLNYANVTTTGLEASREFAIGGQGAPNRIAFDYGRKGTLKVESQIATMELFNMLSGADMENSFQYMKRYVLSASEGTLTIPDADTVAAGTVNVYDINDDCGTTLEVTVASNQITLPSGTTTGDFIVYAIVNVPSGAKSIKFNSNTFPKAFTIYGDTPWKTENDEIVVMHLTYSKAVPQSSFELAFSNSGIITLSVTCDLLANAEDEIYEMSIEDTM